MHLEHMKQMKLGIAEGFFCICPNLTWGNDQIHYKCKLCGAKSSVNEKVRGTTKPNRNAFTSKEVCEMGSLRFPGGAL